jgi:hypothetical protein
MSVERGTYVVRTAGREYVAHVDSKTGFPSLWTGCQACALRMNKAGAHLTAHGNGRRLKVVRLVKKKPPP